MSAAISALAALGAAPAANDLIELLDVSDTSMAGTGTNKKLLISELFTTPVFTTNITTPIVKSAAGVDLALNATAPAATTGASQVGKAVTVTASAAVASTDTAGAAAGGSITITTGAAARNASGNAAGGDLNLVLGTGIGTGTRGGVVITTNSATGLSIGAGGLTNPVVSVVCNTTSQDTGVQVTGGVGATTTGVTLAVLSGATNAALIINSKGSGLIELGPTGSGQVRFSVSGGLVARIDGSKIGVISTHLIGFSSSSSDPNVTDTAFARNAAKIIEINNGTVGSWGSLKAGVNDSGTNTIVSGVTIGHQSSGTPAAGLGIQMLFNLNSTTTADQNAAAIAALWTTATHASRTADLVFYTVNNAGALAEGLRLTGAGGLRNITIAADTAHTDTTVCQDTTTHEFLSGTGTAGICLGTSTLRAKENIREVDSALGSLMRLKPIAFNYLPGKGYPTEKRYFGFGAEDVRPILPELSDLGADGKPQSVDLLGMVPLLVRAIQEQQAELEVLRKRLHTIAKQRAH